MSRLLDFCGGGINFGRHPRVLFEGAGLGFDVFTHGIFSLCRLGLRAAQGIRGRCDSRLCRRVDWLCSGHLLPEADDFGVQFLHARLAAIDAVGPIHRVALRREPIAAAKDEVALWYWLCRDRVGKDVAERSPVRADLDADG